MILYEQFDHLCANTYGENGTEKLDICKILSSEIWRHVGFVITDVSKERVASIFRVEGISKLGTALVVAIALEHTNNAHMASEPRNRHNS
jgi:hypothetical protein